jgi:hypothetical protein
LTFDASTIGIFKYPQARADPILSDCYVIIRKEHEVALRHFYRPVPGSRRATIHRIPDQFYTLIGTHEFRHYIDSLVG